MRPHIPPGTPVVNASCVGHGSVMVVVVEVACVVVLVVVLVVVVVSRVVLVVLLVVVLLVVVDCWTVLLVVVVGWIVLLVVVDGGSGTASRAAPARVTAPGPGRLATVSTSGLPDPGMQNTDASVLARGTPPKRSPAGAPVASMYLQAPMPVPKQPRVA
jgi:hypothetical protein